jgi:hypothetical protein
LPSRDLEEHSILSRGNSECRGIVEDQEEERTREEIWQVGRSEEYCRSYNLRKILDYILRAMG